MQIAQTIVGILGNIISMGLFLSPVPTFIKIVKARSTLDFSSLPYACTMLNCLLWLFYGSPWVVKGILVVTINGFGTVVELMYLTIFVVLASRKQARTRTLMMMACVIGFFGLVVALNMTLAHTKNRRKTIVGILCVIVGTAMYAAPLSVMKTVVRTKSTQYMPFLLSLFSFLNGLLWTTYALIGHDIYITVPNAIGTGLAIIQLVLYACYCRGSGEVHEPQVAAVEGHGFKRSESDMEAPHARGGDRYGEHHNPMNRS